MNYKNLCSIGFIGNAASQLPPLIWTVGMDNKESQLWNGYFYNVHKDVLGRCVQDQNGTKLQIIQSDSPVVYLSRGTHIYLINDHSYRLGKRAEFHYLAVTYEP